MENHVPPAAMPVRGSRSDAPHPEKCLMLRGSETKKSLKDLKKKEKGVILQSV